MIITPSSRLNGVGTYYFATKLQQLRAMANSGIEVLNLGIGSPDLSPHASVIEALQNASTKQDANKYQPYIGIDDFRVAIADWYLKWFRVELNHNNEILPLIGSKEGIMHISMSFLDPGDQVLVPDPGYPSYSSSSILAGANVLSYDLESSLNWQADLAKLEDQNLEKVKIMWLNYPNMPTGADGDLTYFEKLIAFALQHKILLCHDNPYTFILNKNPKSILQLDGAKECCIELMSLSKNYNMAGWRIGACVSNSDVIANVLRFKSNMDSGMYKAIQMAATKALALDNSWFDEINEKYAKRRSVAEAIMKSIGCTCDPDQVGMFVWGKITSTYKNGETLSDMILEKTGVFLTPGFIFGKNGDSYLRISLCSSTEILEKAKLKIQTLNV